MYTDNAEIENETYNEEDYSSNDNRKGLIIKIIIIAVCVIILIWLILALKKSKNNEVVYDPNIHANNIQEVRLAAEKYFFIDGNMPNKGTKKTVTLSTMKGKGLINDIVDANKKVCNDVKSTTSLSDEDASTYILKINLSCSTDENEEVFYYDKKNYTCLNCNGHTLMDGKTKPVEDDTKTISGNVYSCNTWSEWSSKKVNDTSLTERVRKLYIGVKEGKEVEKVTYSDWSEYSKDVAVASDTLEVETKEVVEGVWSETKSTNSYISNTDKIKVVSTSSNGGSYKYCPSGYKKSDDKCISETTTRGDLTYLEYFSGNYIIQNKPCDGASVIPDSNGGHKTVYKNCVYYKTTALKKGYSDGSTTYYYQELVDTPVKYYRYRTKTVEKVLEDNVYTKEYYEENKLPADYKIVPNSEKLEYSYKLAVCEK